MARGPTKSLYLEVGGDIRGLKAATTAGKTVLNEFGGAAINVLEEVEREMAKLGEGGLPNLKKVETAYTETFKRIGASARAVIDAPTPQAAVQIIDASAARQAAENAAAQAAALRLVAEAANRADLAIGGTDAATRAYAVSAATAALNAEEEARALAAQAAVLGRVEGQLEATAGAQRRSTSISGQARAGYQQLSFQLNDVAVQYAAGTAATVIFAQQSSQVIQALQMISGEGNKVTQFLGGAWGVALNVALVALTPFVAKLFEESEASKEARKASDDHRKAVLALGDAKRAELQTTEQKLRADYGEIERERAKALAIRQTIQARLADAIAQQEGLKQGARYLQGEGATSAFIFAANEVDRLKAEAAKNQTEVDRLTGGANAAAAAYVRSIAEANRTPEGRGRRNFDRQRAAALEEAYRTRDWAKYAATIERLGNAQDEEAKALREATAARKRKLPNLGSQVVTERSAELLASAERYRGLNERNDNATLQALFKQAGETVDPKMTAWCAAFVNAVLATNGLPGTGNLSARSFLNYGEKTSAPVPGDIVVSKRGKNAAEGHVGFFQGVDAKGNILVLGGNTADKVGTQRVARSDVLGFRRAAATGKIPDLSVTDPTSDLLSLADYFDPAKIREASERAGRDANDAFRAIFGEADPLAPIIASIEAKQGELVDTMDAVARAASERPLEQLRQRLEEEVGDIGLALEGVAERGFLALEDGLLDIITGTEDVGSAFKKMANGIIADLARVAIRSAILDLLPGVGKFLGFADGGRVLKRAGGGMIYGPGGPRDDLIPTLLSNGEFVINAAATARHRPLIEAINGDRLPRFADGGLVAPTSFVPRLPNIEAARTALQGGRGEMPPIRIVLATKKGEAFETEVLSVSGPATVQIIQQSMPAITNASAARTLEVMGRPGI